MSKKFRRPGVYIKEISTLPKTIIQVPTALPAFIGYTEIAIHEGRSALNTPVRVNSLAEYKAKFGENYQPIFELLPALADDPHPIIIDGVSKSIILKANQKAYLYLSVQDFFYNGGGSCYIISVGTYADQNEVLIKREELLGTASSTPAGIKALGAEKEPSLVLIPDAVELGNEAFPVYQEMLRTCEQDQKRFAIMDIPDGFLERTAERDIIEEFRTGIGNQHLSFGAAYYPWLNRPASDFNLSYKNLDSSIALDEILLEPAAQQFLSSNTKTDPNFHRSLEILSPTYKSILQGMAKKLSAFPSSGAVAGAYSMTDTSRGVWKAPANISLSGFTEPSITINSSQQEDLNAGGLSGKSINAIRLFTGRGVLIWGARTLAGNDNEWRYVPVRRTAIMIEQSIKKALGDWSVEANNSSTWNAVKMSCENFMVALWRQGGLAGAKAEDAFFVRVGLGQTMSPQDILDNLLKVEIGIAMIRPAEFIILRISQKME
ncbi:MAG: phage tail sheath family protein [Bacteroidota bacterium]